MNARNLIAALALGLLLGNVARAQEVATPVQLCRAADRAAKLGLKVSGALPSNCLAVLTADKLEKAKARVVKLEAAAKAVR